jgi:hypothetical protein
MSSTAFFKRILPFIATFAVGIFIASFFVTISGPRFDRRGHGKRCDESRRLRMELDRMQTENDRLREQINLLTDRSFATGDDSLTIAPGLSELPPPPPMPARPAAPRAIR